MSQNGCTCCTVTTNLHTKHFILLNNLNSLTDAVWNDRIAQFDRSPITHISKCIAIYQIRVQTHYLTVTPKATKEQSRGGFAFLTAARSCQGALSVAITLLHEYVCLRLGKANCPRLTTAIPEIVPLCYFWRYFAKMGSSRCFSVCFFCVLSSTQLCKM